MNEQEDVLCWELYISCPLPSLNWSSMINDDYAVLGDIAMKFAQDNKVTSENKPYKKK